MSGTTRLLLLVAVLWIGLHPQPVVGVLHATVRNLLLQVGPLLP